MKRAVKEQLQFAYNEKGFLLIEHLIAIVIMSILVMVILGLMQVVSAYTTNQTALTMHEVNTVATRLQNEIRLANYLTSSGSGVVAHFESQNNEIGFHVQNNRLMRQVNGRGGEILVYNLSSMTVEVFNENSAAITLLSLEGEAFRFPIYTLHITIPEIDEADEDEEDYYEDEYNYLDDDDYEDEYLDEEDEEVISDPESENEVDEENVEEENDSEEGG